jgi:subtilisin-like proprotein convertase family protein
MLKTKILVLFLLFSGFGFSQSFTGFGGSIKDNASRNLFSVSVSGLPSTIGTSFGLFGVELNITHTYTADLNIFLIAPDNTLIELSSGNGGSGRNYTNCILTNNANTKIASGKAPFKGSFKPEGSLGVINNGQNPNQAWRLVIVDTKPNKDTGKLVSWNLIFSNTPSKLEPFISSSLPLMLINTHGKAIPDEPKISAGMRLINNTTLPNKLGDSSKFFNYGITIETRGSSSQSFPKKPYGFTTVLKNLADTNVSLLGLPAEHDWVLNATYNDKSLMRDVLAYELARRTGRYATRYRYCELFINGVYEGIYLLMEKVKRDKNRVDISKLEPKDTVGTALTGGYIVKIDKTTGNNNGGWTDTFPISPGSPNRVYFQYDYPNGDDMSKKQKDYIASAIYKFETALSSSTFDSPTKGYRQFADVSTFIDLSIINEISKNVDGYRLSTYMYKDRDNKDPRLKMGPVWDFNLAFNNADYNNSSDPAGWEIDLSFGCPFWWKRFREDTGYVNSYYCRWNQLRQSTFSLYKINKFLDSTYAYLEEASYRNFQRWPVLGVYIWPNPSPLSYSMREEVDSLKSWIEKRFNWMDGTIAANCNSVKTCAPRVGVFAEKSKVCKYQPVKLFADGVGSTYKWSPSKGLNTTNGREVVATLDATTTFKVVMRTAAGCKDSANITITVLPLPSKTINGVTSICENHSTQLSVTPGYKSYQWLPATFLDNSTSYQVKASPTYNINYKVTITDSLGCYDSAYVTITVNKKPNVIISAKKDSVCAKDSIILTATGATNYRWLAAPGLKDTFGNTAVIIPGNKTEYTVIGTSDKGCIDTAWRSFYNFKRAPLLAEANFKGICFGASVVLTAKQGSGYVWQKTTDFGGSTASSLVVTPKVNTTYKVIGLDKNLCKDSAEVDITVYPAVKIDIAGNLEICKGSSTTLTATGANTYIWLPNLGLNTNTGEQVIASPKQNSKYMVIGSSANLCKDTAEINIQVNNNPTLMLSLKSPEITEGENDTIWVSGALNYKWWPKEHLNQDTGSMVIASPAESMFFTVLGTDVNRCETRDSIFLKVNKKQIAIKSILPLGFLIYPNPFNEDIKIESATSAKLSVRNVQGAEIYTESINPGINSINLGNEAAGIYIFCVQTATGTRYYKVVKE